MGIDVERKRKKVSQHVANDRQRKNIVIEDRRTSVSLEDQVWDGLVDICRREEISIDELCTLVARRRIGSSMSSSLRVFLLTYFRLVARNAEARLGMGAAPGFAHPPQRPFPSMLDQALDQFGQDQKRQSGMA